MHPLAEASAIYGDADEYDRYHYVARGGAQPQGRSEPIGPPPCDHCPLKARCGDKLLACGAFATYVETGDVISHTKREPSRALYRAIMAAG